MVPKQGDDRYRDLDQTSILLLSPRLIHIQDRWSVGWLTQPVQHR
jgi:hypothetical protein